jgi:nucleotide sugar dehydrogenase
LPKNNRTKTHKMRKEKIGIVGTGFVGNAVYEGMKNYFDVLAYDRDPNKRSTVCNALEVIENTELTFLCVPTPMYEDGTCDLSIVRNALDEIESYAQSFEKIGYIVIIKSTIPPGTTEKLNQEYPILSIVFNPEFLTEANAVEDYKNQNRIILGGERPGTTVAKRIFTKAFPKVPIIKTSSTIAEMIKYVTNTFLATKVSFANEMFEICQGLGIDYDKVIEYARYDERLGNSHWLVPGPDGDFGFGGHCFPKDIAALKALAKELEITSTVLNAVIQKNEDVRNDRDWEKMEGRAVSKKTN